MKTPRTKSSGPAFRQARMEGRGEPAPVTHSTATPIRGAQGVGGRPGGSVGQSSGGAAQQRAAGGSSPTKPFATSPTRQGGQAAGMSHGTLKEAAKGGDAPCSRAGPGGIGKSGRGAPIT